MRGASQLYFGRRELPAGAVRVPRACRSMISALSEGGEVRSAHSLAGSPAEDIKYKHQTSARIHGKENQKYKKETKQNYANSLLKLRGCDKGRRAGDQDFWLMKLLRVLLRVLLRESRHWRQRWYEWPPFEGGSILS